MTVQREEENIKNNITGGNIYSIITNYRLPLILGTLGLVFVIISILFLTKREPESKISFIEQNNTLSDSAKIRVDINGAVVNPGVYDLDAGSRIGDLLMVAGGFSSSADRVWTAKYLNQAARLVDGGKIYIPEEGVSIINTTSVLGVGDNIENSANINLNSSSLIDLDTLPGVGQVTAQKIISGRPYQSIEELKRRKIVGNALFEKIKDLVVVY